MHGAVQIFNEIRRRKLNVSIAGIPKTVDNDVGIIDPSFGFQTAVEMAQKAISADQVEAGERHQLNRSGKTHWSQHRPHCPLRNLKQPRCRLLPNPRKRILPGRERRDV